MSNARRARFTERERFSYYLRTGRMLPEFKFEPDGAEEAAPLETKFNPYHDPANGRFTFAPGGPRSLSHVTTSWGGMAALAPRGRASRRRFRAGGSMCPFHQLGRRNQSQPSRKSMGRILS
ncbi:MAG: hypothetical protein R3E04_02815 [Sphingobium sp.]